MKPFRCSPRWLLALVAGCTLWLFLPVAPAFPPAPNHTIYGLVRNEYGEPLADPAIQIIFETSTGVKITGNISTDLEPGTNYRLKIPMDSAAAPDLYKPTAMQPFAPFRIKVKIGQTTYLPIQMVANYANLGKPAGITRIDLTIGEDLDGDGLPDAWQRLLIAMLGPGTKIGPNDDADGDGITNMQEYLAGTYPFDPADGFRLQLLTGPGLPPLLEFMAIKGRTYTVYCSTNLQTWMPVDVKIPADGVAAPNLSRYRGALTRKLQVQPLGQGGVLPDAQCFFKVQVE